MALEEVLGTSRFDAAAAAAVPAWQEVRHAGIAAARRHFDPCACTSNPVTVCGY